MLVKFSGQTIDNFFIPSFNLTNGEIVIIKFPNDGFSRQVELKLIDILSGKVSNKNVELITPLKYAEHFWKTSLWYRLFPMTVAKYHDKYANKANPIFERIYDIEWMTPKIKIETLAGNARRKLSLYTTLSWTNNIIFDLAGVDPQGAEDIYEIVKKVAELGGAAILLNHFEEFKNDCSTYIIAKHVSTGH